MRNVKLIFFILFFPNYNNTNIIINNNYKMYRNKRFMLYIYFLNKNFPYSVFLRTNNNIKQYAATFWCI